MLSELHIGIDSEKIVVAPHPLKMRTGRARRHQTGSVIEVVPVGASGRSREVRLAYAARLTFALIFLTAVLYAVGVPWLMPAIASASAIGLVGRRQARNAQTATFDVPRGNQAGSESEGVVLWAPPERVAFERALTVARRIRRTWPALPDMIDPIIADRSLTHALQDLAGLMARRQEIRRLRTELSGVRAENVPGDSPAVRALAAQRERVEELWLSSAGQANRILRSLDAAALAGEAFLRERAIGETAHAAGQVLDRLTVGAPPADTGPDLADRTDAVLNAYRELAGSDPR